MTLGWKWSAAWRSAFAQSCIRTLPLWTPRSPTGGWGMLRLQSLGLKWMWTTAPSSHRGRPGQNPFFACPGERSLVKKACADAARHLSQSEAPMAAYILSVTL